MQPDLYTKLLKYCSDIVDVPKGEFYSLKATDTVEDKETFNPSSQKWVQIVREGNVSCLSPGETTFSKIPFDRIFATVIAGRGSTKEEAEKSADDRLHQILSNSKLFQIGIRSHDINYYKIDNDAWEVIYFDIMPIRFTNESV